MRRVTGDRRPPEVTSVHSMNPNRSHTQLRRLSRFEPLESRRLLALLQNPVNQFDVDASGLVSPSDVLAVVNAINAQSHANRLGGEVGSTDINPGKEFFLDVNGDRMLSPMDILLVINVLNRERGTLNVALSISPDFDSNGNGVVQESDVILGGQVSKAARLQLTVTALDQKLQPVTGKQAVFKQTVDVASGFEFAPSLFVGLNRVDLTATDLLGNQQTLSQEVVFGDHIADWNAALLNVVRDWTTTSGDPYEGRIVSSSPPIVAKNLAMIHVAMFDALNSFTKQYSPYLAAASPAADASPIAASATAAFEIAAAIYPAAREIAVWRATLAESLAQVDNVSAREKGVAFGRLIADAMLNVRDSDGASQTSTYSPGSFPGEWHPTGPDFLPPLLPLWGSVKLFAVSNVTDFRPPPPPELTSAEYAAAVDEVLRLGRADNAERTLEQTEIAAFWADGGGTATPPGHWNRIAIDLSLANGQSTLERARTLALLNVGLADAGISAWDAKYAYDFWRPIDAIRRAAEDGNAATAADSTWQPLLQTPPFPTYTSGHSTFSGAAATILTSIFGENVAFATRSDVHTGPTQRPPATLPARHFDSLWAAAEEAGVSRIYGGIHFSFDNTAGLSAGDAIGLYVANHLLTPIA